MAQLSRASAAPLSLPENYEGLSPTGRICALAHPENRVHDVRAFLRDTSPIYVLPHRHASLRPAASGVEWCAFFCDLLSILQSPSQADIVRQWGSIFRSGGTFSRYLAHRRKAFQLLYITIGWYALAIRAIASGVENAQDMSTRFGNYIFIILARHLRGKNPAIQNLGVCATYRLYSSSGCSLKDYLSGGPSLLTIYIPAPYES